MWLNIFSVFLSLIIMLWSGSTMHITSLHIIFIGVGMWSIFIHCLCMSTNFLRRELTIFNYNSYIKDHYFQFIVGPFLFKTFLSLYVAAFWIAFLVLFEGVWIKISSHHQQFIYNNWNYFFGFVSVKRFLDLIYFFLFLGCIQTKLIYFSWPGDKCNTLIHLLKKDFRKF